MWELLNQAVLEGGTADITPTQASSAPRSQFPAVTPSRKTRPAEKGTATATQIAAVKTMETNLMEIIRKLKVC